MKRNTVLAYCILSLTIISYLTRSVPATAVENLHAPLMVSPILEVVYDHATDLLSIHTHQALLGDILQKISKEANLSIESSNKEFMREEVSIYIKSLSLEKALKKLLEGFNSAFEYLTITDIYYNNPDPRLTRIVLLSKKMHVSTEAMKESRGEKERGTREESLREVLSGENVLAYDRTIATLKDLPAEKAVDALGRWLQADHRQMRVRAAAELGNLGDEGAISPLLAALTGNDPVTRQAAASSLARIRGDKATSALSQAYLAGNDGLKRAVAVAIASHGDENSQRALANLIAEGHAPGDGTPQEAGRLSNIEHSTPNERR